MVYGLHTPIRMSKTKSVAIALTGKSVGQANECMKQDYTQLSNPMANIKQIYSNK
jgi:hypothetical protein